MFGFGLLFNTCQRLEKRTEDFFFNSPLQEVICVQGKLNSVNDQRFDVTMNYLTIASVWNFNFAHYSFLVEQRIIIRWDELVAYLKKQRWYFEDLELNDLDMSD